MALLSRFVRFFCGTWLWDKQETKRVNNWISRFLSLYLDRHRGPTTKLFCFVIRWNKVTYSERLYRDKNEPISQNKQTTIVVGTPNFQQICYLIRFLTQQENPNESCKILGKHTHAHTHTRTHMYFSHTDKSTFT